MGETVKIAVLENSESGALLIARTLKRKIPEAVIVAGLTAESAMNFSTDPTIDLYIVHRVAGEDAATVVARIKHVRPNVPVIMISSADRTQEAADAGADAFLLFEQWLLIAPTTARLLSRTSGGESA